MTHSKKNDLPIKWLVLINAYSIASEKAKTCHKGCKNCPFLYDSDYFPDECNLSHRVDVTEIEIRKLEPDRLNKPDGCPFKGFPGNLEISAMEPE